MTEQRHKRVVSTKEERRIQAENTSAYVAEHTEMARRAREEKNARLKAQRTGLSSTT